MNNMLLLLLVVYGKFSKLCLILSVFPPLLPLEGYVLGAYLGTALFPQRSASDLNIALSREHRILKRLASTASTVPATESMNFSGLRMPVRNASKNIGSKSGKMNEENN